jgi:hypothetical protein
VRHRSPRYQIANILLSSVIQPEATFPESAS